MKESQTKQEVAMRIFRYGLVTLILLLLAFTALNAQNLVTNGEFNNGMDGWWVGVNTPGEVESSIDDSGMLSGDSSLMITVTNGGTETWHVLAIAKVELETDKEYELTLQALADMEMTIMVSISQTADPYATYWSRNMNIGSEEVTFGPYAFKNTKDDPLYDLKFWLGGVTGVTIWLDSIWVKEKVESGIEKNMTGFAVDYTLGQNYPNPFNPSTNISYTLPEAANVRMEIYNLAGQKIKTLIDNYYTAGSYTLTWNGDDYNGSQVPSGMYVYKIFAQGQNRAFTETKKMLFLK